ncbi:MAG: 5-formyltetrahydrofolate cyclo-ligase [Clostridia bacterium]|nr:5-formyltetrahydrofolate cyclo-ligase [Clostridia bacterium]
MTKQELRRLLKEKRAAISAEQKKEYDSAIVKHILASALFCDASMLLLYAPMEGEITLLPLVRAARSMGKPIAFPRCNTADNTMAFYILEPNARLTEGAYHIPEPPADASLCVPDERALCILPGLSFDPNGNRLGYGKGYYDRYLATFPGVTLGALYAQMMLKKIPTDAHDLPARYLVTEHGMMSVSRSESEEPPKLSQKARTSFSDFAKQIARAGVQATKALIRDARTQGKDGIRALHAPPVLVICTFVLLFLSNLIDANLLDRDNEYIGAILLQILIFVIPALLYCKLRGEKFTDRIRMHLIRASQLFFVLCMLILMITGSLLSSILTGGIASLSGNFTLYGTFVARTGTPADIVYSILAYALLPALGEELIFRSILAAEYEKYGVGVAVTVSALMFAMLHFSFTHFLTYLLLGLLLAFAMYATRSFFTPFLLHLCYNIFCLFGQPFLSAFYVNAGSTEIFLFCLVVLFLLFAALTSGEARKIYHVYATKNVDASYTVSVPLKEYPRRILFALFTPAFAVCIVFFLVMTIVNLF